jgi:DNA adenine methylase
MRLTTPLKFHGGKYYLTRQILNLMPPHLLYREPFCGSAKVLFARDPMNRDLWTGVDGSHRGAAEMVNDRNGHLTNFYDVLKSEELFPRFARIVNLTPFSSTEWERAHTHVFGKDPVANAAAFFVNNRQSWSGIGKTHAAVTRNRTRRGMDNNVSEWLGAVDGLREFHERLRLVRIENMDALAFIRREDSCDSLSYCDPPYPHSTRQTADAYGPFEMTDAEHQELLDVLCQCKGKIIVSGYPCAMYDQALSDWNRHTEDRPNHAAGGKKKPRVTEVLWCNF